MAKFSGNTKNLIRVPLASLIDGDNVRRVYDADEISQLANSILRDGLLSPLVVNSGEENEDGLKNYVVICGHRRLRALKKLAEDGNDVGLVECVIRAGDTWTMQMVENVQRVDLSPAEKEAAVRQMIDAGMSQTEIAERVSKPLSWVSDILAGGRVREAAENAGVDTSGISTRALSQLRSVPDAKMADAVQELRDAGGSVKAATEILHERKDEWTGQQRFDDSEENDEAEEDADEATTHVSSCDSGDAFDVFEEGDDEAGLNKNRKIGGINWNEFEMFTDGEARIIEDDEGWLYLKLYANETREIKDALKANMKPDGLNTLRQNLLKKVESLIKIMRLPAGEKTIRRWGGKKDNSESESKEMSVDDYRDFLRTIKEMLYIYGFDCRVTGKQLYKKDKFVKTFSIYYTREK